MQRTGILLVNLGSPDSPSVPGVRKYLKEFLLDPRVIDIPDLQRNLLVRMIIAPFRAPKSAANYRKIWMEEGSPLIVHTKRLKEKLQQHLGDIYFVDYAMRYQSPSIENALKGFQEKNITRIIVIPLFPQYASASTGSVIEKVMSIVQAWTAIPEIHFVSSFHNDPLFIEAFAEKGKEYHHENFDHILFSFHGLPERQIKKTSPQNNCLTEGCCNSMHAKNAFCYRAQCYDTARLLGEKLSIAKENYTVCFQSRLGKTPWIKPYSDEVIRKLAKEGKKKILVFSPSFAADCLETIYEIGEEYDILFRSAGGEKVTLVESLNDGEGFVGCLGKMVNEFV